MIDPVRTGSVSGIAASATVASRGLPGATPTARREAALAEPLGTAMPLPQLYNLIADLADAPPPVDYAKVAQIRRAIADGDYRIDVGALAHAILRSDAEV